MKYNKAKMVMYIYGIIALCGMFIAAFTNPLTVDNNLKLFYDKNLMLNSYEMKNLLYFLLISGSIYFLSVKMYYRNKTD